MREKTGAPIGECKDALSKAATDLKQGEDLNEKAFELLRKKGIATAQKKAGRLACCVSPVLT